MTSSSALRLLARSVSALRRIAFRGDTERAADLRAATVIGGIHRQLDNLLRVEDALHRGEGGVVDAVGAQHAVGIGEDRALALVEQLVVAPLREAVDLGFADAAAHRDRAVLLVLIVAVRELGG